MADISTITKAKPSAYDSFVRLGKEYQYIFDFTDEMLADIRAVGTHNLIKVPKNKALIGFKIIVLADVTSAGAVTLQVKHGVANITSAIAKASLVKGVVFNYPSQSIVTWNETADTTIDVIIGTAALTGGKVLLIPDLIDISEIVTV